MLSLTWPLSLEAECGIYTRCSRTATTARVADITRCTPVCVVARSTRAGRCIAAHTTAGVVVSVRRCELGEQPVRIVPARC